MKPNGKRRRKPRMAVVILGAGLVAACGARGSLLDASGGGNGGGTSSSGIGGFAASSSSTSVSNSASASSSSTSVSSSASTSSSSSGVVCKPEICDGIDNDCNGAIDDGDPGGGADCDTGSPGACANGVTACKEGQIICLAKSGPSAEICDGLDNDCNGVIDEGCSATGCSDGTREGYLDLMKYPKIAACSGGWTAPGLLSTTTPLCGRMAGNNSVNPTGTGCSVADLCAVGFHVCTGPAEVQARSTTGCNGAAPGPGLFFATRQSSNGCNACALGNNTNPNQCNGATCQTGCAQTALTANDLYGCGSVGDEISTCGILNRASNNLCTSLPPVWSCPDDLGEAVVVVKPGSNGGGVLCCSD